MTLFQGKFNLESWTHFSTTEHRFSPIGAFHSRFGIHHVHEEFVVCYVYLNEYQELALMHYLKGKCAIYAPFWHFFFYTFKVTMES